MASMQPALLKGAFYFSERLEETQTRVIIKSGDK
jgi:hypothetical protein